MSYKFSDEDKQVREFKESMPFGVSEVQFVGAAPGETANGKEYVEVGIVNKDGVEDSVKLFFVGGAANISFNTLRDVAVHIAKDDAAKEKTRQLIDGVADVDELCSTLNELCASGQIWFTKYYDAQGRTFTNQYGTFKSINKNIYGWEPKLKPELMPQKTDDNTELTKDNVADAFPGSSTEPANNIPDNWA